MRYHVYIENVPGNSVSISWHTWMDQYVYCYLILLVLSLSCLLRRQAVSTKIYDNTLHTSVREDK